MAEYKAIRGHTIRTIAGDADPVVTGDIWYNSVTKKIRGAKLGAGSWATGNAMVTGRGQMGCTGTQTAAVIAGGIPSSKDNCETYNGSTWTEANDLNTGVQYNILFGTQTAAINTNGVGPSGSANSDNTEVWNGTSWTTSPADLNTGREKVAAANQGTTTAGCVFAGQTDTPFPPTLTYITKQESWNGTAWTEEADVSTGRAAGGGGGTATAAILTGGYTGSNNEDCEIWNGTSWTEVNDINTAGQAMGSAGITTYALIYGGDSRTEATEQFDGTSWTEVGDLAVARAGLGKGTGTVALALAAGFDGSPNTATEEWTEAIAASSFTSS